MHSVFSFSNEEEMCVLETDQTLAKLNRSKYMHLKEQNFSSIQAISVDLSY